MQNKKKWIANSVIIALIISLFMTVSPAEVHAAVTGLGESDIPAKYRDYEVINCIDTSKWQGQLTTDNWEDIYAYGVDAAFLRAGHTTLSTGEHRADSTFPKSIEGAYDAGIEIGAYYFTTATSPEEAKAEAEFFLKIIEPYRDIITLPVVFDFETNRRGKLTNSMMNSLGVDGCTEICEAFCDTVKAAGYDPMIYASSSVLEHNVDAKKLESKYKIWVASYPRGSRATRYDGEYYAWQYSSSVRIDGIKGRVDADYIFRDLKTEESDRKAEERAQLANLSANASSGDNADSAGGLSAAKSEYHINHIIGKTEMYKIDNVKTIVPKKTTRRKAVVNVRDKDHNIHSYIVRKKRDESTIEENMLATLMGGFFSRDKAITPSYVRKEVEPAVLLSFREGRKLSVYGMATILEQLRLKVDYHSSFGDKASYDISAHLAKGKPAIVSAGGKAHLLLSMDEDGNAIEAVFTGDDRIKKTDIDALISGANSKGSTRSLFYNTSQQNGYILVDLQD